MRLSSCSGPFRSIVEARTLVLRNWTSTTGLKSLALFRAGMIRSASINSTRIKSQRFRKVIGSNGKTKSWSGLFVRMVPSSGARSPISSTKTLEFPEMESNAERGG